MSQLSFTEVDTTGEQCFSIDPNKFYFDEIEGVSQNFKKETNTTFEKCQNLCKIYKKCQYFTLKHIYGE